MKNALVVRRKRTGTMNSLFWPLTWKIIACSNNSTQEYHRSCSNPYWCFNSDCANSDRSTSSHARSLCSITGENSSGNANQFLEWSPLLSLLQQYNMHPDCITPCLTNTISNNTGHVLLFFLKILKMFRTEKSQVKLRGEELSVSRILICFYLIVSFLLQYLQNYLHIQKKILFLFFQFFFCFGFSVFRVCSTVHLYLFFPCLLNFSFFLFKSLILFFQNWFLF